MKGISRRAGKDDPLFNGRFVISGRKPKKLVKTEEKKKNGEQKRLPGASFKVYIIIFGAKVKSTRRFHSTHQVKY